MSNITHNSIEISGSKESAESVNDRILVTEDNKNEIKKKEEMSLGMVLLRLMQSKYSRDNIQIF